MLEIPDNNILENAMLRILSTYPSGLTTREINNAVAEILELDSTLLGAKRADGRLNYGYQMAWVRTKAKNKELVSRVGMSHWRIEPKGLNRIDSV